MEDRGSESPAALDAGAAAAASPGSRPERTQDAADAPFDVAGFQQYLKQLLPLVIQADERDLDPLLEADEFKDRAARWATDPNAGALYVVKSRSESVDDAAQDPAGESFVYALSTTVSYSPSQSATFALIKHVPVLDSNLPLSAQLQFLNLFGPASSGPGAGLAGSNAAAATGSAVYEGLHRLLHYGVAPAFEAYVESKARKDDVGRGADDGKDADAKMGIPVTKKKFAELELSLLHLQQNVEIPEVVLSIHPVVRAAIAKAESAGVRPSTDLIDPALFSDAPFLNRLQGEVNSWVKEVQTVTKLSRDVASGTASQEINFWLGMEKALEGIEQQLKSDPVQLSLDILKHAKRFHATVSFIADTGLNDAFKVVHDYNVLMKDFPLNELLAATDLAKLQESVNLVFGHLNKKLKLSPYPVRRALPLVEAISRDLNSQLLRVLSSQRLTYLDYPLFERAMSACQGVFQAWDDSFKEFTNVAREVTRKRSEKFIPIKISPVHAKLQERVVYFRQFRKQHHQLQVMVGPLGAEARRAAIEGEGAADVDAEASRGEWDSTLGDIDMEAEVRQAYESVKEVNILDVSTEGTDFWIAGELAYNERVARVENHIISRLRDRLGGAKNANEMFRVFSKFNALFVRPKIRGAIAEYQTQLIDSVKDDIRALQDKFKLGYQSSEAYAMAQLRDQPPVAGAITWAKQIERQLYHYMKRVEDVLGREWSHYAEGQRLQTESQSFREKLNPRPIYEAWLADINRRNLQIGGRLFNIAKNRQQNGDLQLVVNFDPQIISLFKEVRNLLWLGYQVPHSLSNLAKDAKRVYPYAVSLMETVRTYAQTVAKLEANPEIASLVATVHQKAQEQIVKGFACRWDHFVNSFDSRAGVGSAGSKHTHYVREFASIVSDLQDRTDYLVGLYADVARTVDDLGTCAYDSEAFSALLASLQKTVDTLNLEGYANLEHWTAELDRKVEAKLRQRIRTVLASWSRDFASATADRRSKPSDAVNRGRNATWQANASGEEDGSGATTLVHEVRIQDQIIFLDPPLEQARAVWYRELQERLTVVCSLTRVQSSRYEVGLRFETETPAATNYSELLLSFEDGTLERPFELVEQKLGEVGLYVDKWLQFQSLWDLEAEDVYAQLGDQLSQWQQLLLEIRKTRSTFDNSELRRSFGIIEVDYEQVQSKVTAKYDTWQRDIVARFGAKLGAAMKDSLTAIAKARHELETHSIETSSTSATVAFITFVQDVKRRAKQWEAEVAIFSSGQKTLERQRYHFPPDWTYLDHVANEWSAFNEILSRKTASIQEQLAGLQLKIVAEDKILRSRIDDAIAAWDADKPIQGSLRAEDAMNAISGFELRIGGLQEQHELLSRAKESLDLEVVADTRLEPIAEELRDLKAVWTALSGVWAQINEMRETMWATVQTRKIRQQLDNLLASTREMPSRMRQYAAFEHVQDVLRGYLKSNALLGDLRSEALRDRHWRQLYKALRIAGTYSPSTLTLGSVWDLDLKKNEGAIRDVVVQAQGEMALEEFLKQVKEAWTSYTLDLVNYQNKTRLIRGWDDLFAKCGENVNSLTAMRHSPYYKVFEEEASSWEDRLNRVHQLFDVWIDVQRQWVYLEGIFTGSADIKHLLPTETQRFNNINAEFLALMKKVSKSPFVLDVLNIAGVQKSLERLADLLAKIQKALGEYLERERQSFPRFYFVGDEDLLEIIGNSKDITRVGKFLKKMFAGLSSLSLDSEESQIEGMASREGETIPFAAPIVLAEYPKINDWLARLEEEMKRSLAGTLQLAHRDLKAFFLSSDALDGSRLLAWIDQYPAQLVVLAVQIAWTSLVEGSLASEAGLSQALSIVLRTLDLLADAVLGDLPVVTRRKCEHLITELVHERDVIRRLEEDGIRSSADFDWLYHMRFYLDETRGDLLEQLEVRMASAKFSYGFEYLGVPDRLVQTPLTDRCYLTLTQALDARLGGSPFGPAGTGKTESVKALGVALGRFVLVFCCDETFDFQAMGRIFVGLCQVGAWGCFDEFNRLEERILSAVSQQIQTIQLGLAASAAEVTHEIELVGRQLRLNADTGIFITMNPGYAGRSNLPDNLKKLFRSIAMTRPDRELIAQVMLFSQGFRTAEQLASKIVPFFNLCAEQLSSQPHYDFGLRALKAVLVSAGQLKRAAIGANSGAIDQAKTDVAEQELIMRSVRETIVPKLVADDVPLLTDLLSDVFPGIAYRAVDLGELERHISEVCARRQYMPEPEWLAKVIQLYQIQNIQHGVMMVGSTATGKSTAWRTLLTAVERLSGTEGVSYVIDPKAISKDALYGTLDPTTREWNDGLFTSILRKIVDDVRGESFKFHWIVFDGDVDPEWVENLNSVLDDNKLLTLPNGERLSLPSNVRILFEVESLRSATLATVSRCGMVWFSEDTVTTPMQCRHYLASLRAAPMTADSADLEEGDVANGADADATLLARQNTIAGILEPFLAEDGLVLRSLHRAAGLDHIMTFAPSRALSTLFSLLNKAIRTVVEYDNQHADFPLSHEQVESFVSKKMLVGIVWAFTGDSKLEIRADMGNYLRNQSGLEFPPLGLGDSLIDFDAHVGTGAWVAWQDSVPTVEIETQAVTSAEVVVPTIDTARHEEVLYAWLSEHKPLLLCGPPGSGKTMTLFSALRKLPDLDVVGLNFSSATTPELILKTFEQHCEYRKTTNGVVLAPTQIGRWLVLFCDEINLPAPDTYGTQRVITFLRQLVEHRGFWRSVDRAWVRIENIQFVGACNPPTDPGRVRLSGRFLRHAPLVMVDYPGETSLKQIYGTFARAMLKVVPPLRGFAEPLTNAMVDFYLASQHRFTADQQAHYVYSPRELTRWVRGIYEAIKPLDALTMDGLVRVWAHEALRLFQDRLVHESERRWTDEQVDEIALRHFPTLVREEALSRPILYSNWLSRHYVPVDREELREYTKARLRVFYEEELDVPLVLFNDVLDHVLRIDRVFRQTQGHLLLIGVSGSGKTTLSRFVAWMNGLSVFQIKVHNRYTADDFDDDLRGVLRRAGCKGEKIAFIMDESNVLDAGFLERMNTLLANAEVPGLFEGDDYAALLTACREGSQREGVMLDSPDELYRWFTAQVAKNLHVVFTMNPPADGLAGRAATSPALFNRCVLDWFGDWSDQAFFQVGGEFTAALDLDAAAYEAPQNFPVAFRALSLPPTHRSAVINALVYVHQGMYQTNGKLSRRRGRTNYATPRHFIEFVNQYVRLVAEKRDALEEQQRHVNVGLEKLRETVQQVDELRKGLAAKRIQLEAKNNEANDKLRRMVADQQDAEQKKVASIEMSGALEKQKAAIAQRREAVMYELADAEPAVEDAQAAVSNIKKQQLTEVRSMANPPEAVKLSMEAVCILLGHKIDGWKAVQGILRSDTFIASIVNYDTAHSLKPELRKRMRDEYLSRPTFNFETVNRASKACGPLVKWVFAQVNYSDILDKVGPLRNEVQALEDQAETTMHQADALASMIAELEARIAEYKEEYATLISETQTIKLEMDKVESRVGRSVTLLASLSSENERWEASSRTFEDQMSTIAGDALLSAAFIAYAGYFDQTYRHLMWQSWATHLTDAAIRYKPDLSLIEYLSSAEDRLAWTAHSLPSDDLCTENAIALQRSARYPLIVDPAGQATAFLVEEYRDRKIAVTSFLDGAFLKNLESALRFGTPLLIQDVEYLDPILNAVLNKELRRAGGRVLIRLGNQDIDFSPAFTLFLTTRDPSAEFAADLNSRVTLVNFSITRASLQTQSLAQVLRVERPEIDRKRSDLLRLQGEFRARLLHLEKSLLAALNASEGNILDDDTVIETLETLKKEAAEVSVKVAETDTIMGEVTAVTNEYLPLAQACSDTFFTLDELRTVNHFYQFSLRFFLDAFEAVILDNPSLANVTDLQERLRRLIDDFFLVVFKRASRSLLHADYLTLAVLLAQIKLRAAGLELLPDEYSYLLEGGGVLTPGARGAQAPSWLDPITRERLATLERVEGFQSIRHHLETHADEWQRCIASEAPEASMPQIWDDLHPTSSAFRQVLLIKCLRPDRLLPSLTEFVNVVFARDMLLEAAYGFDRVVQDEITAATPVCLVSVPGHDASYRVDALVQSTSARCTSVAMGAQEGVGLAEQAIAAAAKNGTWVLLKNVHLAPTWLGQLEKRLQTLGANRAFRLFLTMESTPSIPVNILRQGRVLMNEPPPGIRANLLDSLAAVDKGRSQSGPAERTRLHFLLAWFHAVVQERLRYTPLGWTKGIEFNDSDLSSAIRTIDTWLAIAAKGKANVDPAVIPWKAIRALLRETIYGGKIDTFSDQTMLDSFVDKLFSPRAYDLDFVLVSREGPDHSEVVAPDATQLDQFVAWARTLPEQEPPSYLALPVSAERVISTEHGKELLTRLLKLRSLDDDETIASEVQGKQTNAQPAWMQTLKRSSQDWHALLPESAPKQQDSQASGTDPLGRFWNREFAVAQKLVPRIRSDLSALIRVCDGDLKQTNDLRALLADLVKGTVPAAWRKYRCRDLPVAAWIVDLAKRLAQLQRVAAAKEQDSEPVSLGLLFTPHGFVTASRQTVAHKQKVSLEELVLDVSLEAVEHPNSFTVQGLVFAGAELSPDGLRLNDGSLVPLASSSLVWRSKQDVDAASPARAGLVSIPCFLDATRADVLFDVGVRPAAGVDVTMVVQRAVAVIAASE